MPNDTLTQSVFLDYNLFTPIVQFNLTQLTDQYRPGYPWPGPKTSGPSHRARRQRSSGKLHWTVWRRPTM